MTSVVEYSTQSIALLSRSPSRSNPVSGLSTLPVALKYQCATHLRDQDRLEGRNIQLDVIIASPHDSVHAAGEILEEKPEAQESNPDVPFVPNEAG